MSERITSLEFSPLEIALIESLHDDPSAEDTLKQLEVWTKVQERRVGQENTSRATIELNLRLARLYHAAGLLAAAWKALEDVREQAHNEGEDDLLNAAEVLMDLMDSGV